MVGDVNAQLQQQIGLFNPEVAVQVDVINQQLARTAPISVPSLAHWL